MPDIMPSGVAGWNLNEYFDAPAPGAGNGSALVPVSPGTQQPTVSGNMTSLAANAAAYEEALFEAVHGRPMTREEISATTRSLEAGLHQRVDGLTPGAQRQALAQFEQTSYLRSEMTEVIDALRDNAAAQGKSFTEADGVAAMHSLTEQVDHMRARGASTQDITKALIGIAEHGNMQARDGLEAQRREMENTVHGELREMAKARGMDPAVVDQIHIDMHPTSGMASNRPEVANSLSRGMNPGYEMVMTVPGGIEGDAGTLLHAYADSRVKAPGTWIEPAVNGVALKSNTGERFQQAITPGPNPSPTAIAHDPAPATTPSQPESTTTQNNAAATTEHTNGGTPVEVTAKAAPSPEGGFAAAAKGVGQRVAGYLGVLGTGLQAVHIFAKDDAERTKIAEVEKAAHEGKIPQAALEDYERGVISSLHLQKSFPGGERSGYAFAAFTAWAEKYGIKDTALLEELDPTGLQAAKDKQNFASLNPTHVDSAALQTPAASPGNRSTGTRTV